MSALNRIRRGRYPAQTHRRDPLSRDPRAGGLPRGGQGANHFIAPRGAIDDDECYGDAGDDSISGCEGDDVLHGGSGMDVLDDLTGSDRIDGETGDDIISGNLGNKGPDLEGDEDTLIGGAGNDDFDCLDSADEVRDCYAADDGRNGCVPTYPGVKALIDGRSFDEREYDPPPADGITEPPIEDGCG